MAIFKSRSPDVLVVGAGPVGLFAALALARRGVKVAILDSEWRSAAHSYALALHPSSLELLDRFRLAPAVLERSYHVKTIGLWDENTRRASLSIGELPRERALVAVSRQDVLESTLEAALRESGVKIQWDHRVSRIEPGDSGVEVTVDQLDKQSGGYAVSHVEKIVARRRDMTVPFVIGADGHRSFVRNALGIEFEEMSPAEQYAVFEFETDADLDHELRIAFAGEQASVCWPLPDGACRWSFQLSEAVLPDDGRQKSRLTVQLGAASYPVLQESVLEALLKARAPWFQGKVGPIHWRMAVRFEKRLAASFGSGRVWLAGDSAHMAAPIGVQSMNGGLAEAAQLAEAIADVLGGSGGQDALDRYGAERRAGWLRMLGPEGPLAAPSGADPWLAARAGRLAQCLPVSGGDIAVLARQVGLKAV